MQEKSMIWKCSNLTDDHIMKKILRFFMAVMLLTVISCRNQGQREKEIQVEETVENVPVNDVWTLDSVYVDCNEI